MSVLASFALFVTLLSPQGTPPVPGQEGATAGADRPALLTPAEQQALRGKLVKFLDATDQYDRATATRAREKASKNREKAKDDFEKDWDKFEKKGNLLGSMPDMRAIFDNCFLLAPPSFSLGQLRQEKLKDDGSEYSFFLPKSYRADKPQRTVVVLPGTAAADSPAWTKPADYFGSVWDKTSLLNSSIVHVCHLPAGLELDPIPDLSREGDDAEEGRRIRATLSGLGDLMSNYNVDRGSVFLDCGRGTCGFGLRFLTMFPDRFAGVVLREPVAVDDIRLGSLFGKPVLLVKTAATAAVVEALQKRLDAVSPGACTILEAADEYPHKGLAAAIEEWMGKHRRNMTPMQVVIEPNHDLFNRSYWVDIDRADPILGATLDDRPRIEVQADRKANRIVVKANKVESFVLFLNDDIVDLDKEFTVVVNDKAVTEKKIRSFRDMRDRMVVRKDWEYLFPVMYGTTVPKPAAEDGAPKK